MFYVAFHYLQTSPQPHRVAITSFEAQEACHIVSTMVPNSIHHDVVRRSIIPFYPSCLVDDGFVACLVVNGLTSPNARSNTLSTHCCAMPRLGNKLLVAASAV